MSAVIIDIGNVLHVVEVAGSCGISRKEAVKHYIEAGREYMNSVSEKARREVNRMTETGGDAA